MSQNEAYRFLFERELTNILGEDKVLCIKNCGLEEIFDDLYNYYFEYSKHLESDIIKAYDIILNALAIWFRDELIARFSKMLYGYMSSPRSYEKEEQK